MKYLITLSLLLLFISSSFAQKCQWRNENVQTVSGTITDNTRPCSFIKTSDGKEYKVHMGPVWYWNQNNYSLALSDATIKGSVVTIDNVLNLFPFVIEQGANKIILADDNGVPKWGAGNGKGNGNGRGNCWRNGNGNNNGNGRGNCWRNKN